MFLLRFLHNGLFSSPSLATMSFPQMSCTTENGKDMMVIWGGGVGLEEHASLTETCFLVYQGKEDSNGFRSHFTFVILILNCYVNSSLLPPVIKEALFPH